MPKTGIIETLYADKEQTQPLYPKTHLKAVNDSKGHNLDTILTNEKARWAGAWIEFTDENGNPTDEPFLHYAVDENGRPVFSPEISFAEDGEF
jgi:hypothetical protein